MRLYVVHEVVARRAVLVAVGDRRDDVAVLGVVACGARRVQRREVRVRGCVARGADAGVGPGDLVKGHVVDGRVARGAVLVAVLDRRDDRSVLGTVTRGARAVDRGQVGSCVASHTGVGPRDLMQGDVVDRRVAVTAGDRRRVRLEVATGADVVVQRAGAALMATRARAVVRDDVARGLVVMCGQVT